MKLYIVTGHIRSKPVSIMAVAKSKKKAVSLITRSTSPTKRLRKPDSLRATNVSWIWNEV